MSDNPIADALYIEWLEHNYVWVDLIELEDDARFDWWMGGDD